MRGFAEARGNIALQRVGKKTTAIGMFASSPLKLLSTRSSSDCAWIFTSTYGGGLVDGDSIRLDVAAGAGTRCLLSTQASTKVYRSRQIGCRQMLNASLDDDAVLVIAPDPIVCFADARFEQQQRFDLSASAGLVLLDWLSSGRWARGERWAFEHYQSRTDVSIGGAAVYRDVLVLDAVDGQIDGPMRMGRFDCFATMLIVGAPLRTAAAAVLAYINEQPAPGRDEPLIFAASPIADGVVVRAAGPSSEVVGRWIRQRLDFLPSLIGQDPWARKW
jgi:urease accessory protein